MFEPPAVVAPRAVDCAARSSSVWSCGEVAESATRKRKSAECPWASGCWSESVLAKRTGPQETITGRGCHRPFRITSTVTSFVRRVLPFPLFRLNRGWACA